MPILKASNRPELATIDGVLTTTRPVVRLYLRGKHRAGSGSGVHRKEERAKVERAKEKGSKEKARE